MRPLCLCPDVHSRFWASATNRYRTARPLTGSWKRDALPGFSDTIPCDKPGASFHVSLADPQSYRPNLSSTEIDERTQSRGSSAENGAECYGADDFALSPSHGIRLSKKPLVLSAF